MVTVRCRRDGEPVFTRLKNGRVRFTWGVPQLLWVRLQVQQRRLAVPVGTALDALTMPATLGDKVLAELRIMMLPGGHRPGR